MDRLDAHLIEYHARLAKYRRKINLIRTVFGSSNLHCIILSYLSIPCLIQSELVNKEWNLHAKNPACVTYLNFKHCYHHKGFNETYFQSENNRKTTQKMKIFANSLLSTSKYFFNNQKQYDPNDINNKE